MKKISLHARIAVALLMAVIMIFSVIAVTAFAASSDDSNVIAGGEGAWYTLSTGVNENGHKKISVLVNPELLYDRIASTEDITKDEVKALINEIVAKVYGYAMDKVTSSFGGVIGSDDTASADMVFELVANNATDLSALKALAEKYIKEYTDYESLDEILEDKDKMADVIESATQEGDFKDAITSAATDFVSAYITVSGNTNTDALKAEVNDMISAALDKVYENEPDAAEKVDELKGKLNVVVDESFESSKQYTFEELLTFVYSNLEAVTLGGETIFADGTVNPSGIKNVLMTIPTPYEMKDWAAEDFESLLCYELGVEFSFADFAVEVEVGLELDDGACEKVKAVMAIIANHIDVSVANNDGVYSIAVELKVPDEFAALTLKALKSGKISDGLKNKVFNALGKDGEDVETFIANLTLDDIIEAFERTGYGALTVSDVIEILGLSDYSGILDAEFIKDYVDINNVSGDDLVALVERYREYFDIAQDALIRILNKVPNKFMDNTLSSIYEGDGVFYVREDAEINVEDVLTMAVNNVPDFLVNELKSRFPGYADEIDELLQKSEKLPGYVASFIPEDYKTVVVDVAVKVEFLDVYKVEYRNADGTLNREGFLPVGADLTMFGGDTEWIAVDENGNLYTDMVMPECDIVLYPKDSFTVTGSENIETVYDKDTEYSVSVDAVCPFGEDMLEYQWYLEDEPISGATESTYGGIKNVLDSGTYKCVVTVKGTNISKSAEVSVDIDRQQIEFPYLYWRWMSWERLEFEYNGNLHTVNITGVPSEWDGIVYYVVENNTATDAGEYTLNYRFEILDKDNYCFISTRQGFEVDSDGIITGTKAWKITPKALQLPNNAFEWNDDGLVYDGTEKTVEITNIPEDWNGKVRVDYEGNVGTNAGNYRADFTFTITNSNYCFYKFSDGTIISTIGDWENWSIAQKSIDLSEVKWAWTDGTNSGDYTSNTKLVYNPNITYTVALIGLPSEWANKVTVRYSNNSAKDAGEYIATFDFVNVEEGFLNNYSYTAPAGLAWEVEKAVIDVSGIKWDYEGAFTYDGTEHKVELSGVPSEITVTYGETFKATEAGQYKATYTYTYDDNNYVLSGNMPAAECQWEITAAEVTPPAPGPEPGPGTDPTPTPPAPPAPAPGYTAVEIKDAAGKVIMVIDVPNDLAAAPSAGDVYNTYKDTDFSSMLDEGKIGILVSVYDITFKNGDTVIDINGNLGTFKVKYAIPSEYADKTDFVVFYISEAGEITKHNVTVANGYAEFETNHFSVYALVSVEDEEAAGTPWWVWLLIVLAVVIGGGAVAVVVVYLCRKKSAAKAQSREDARNAENVHTTPSVGEAAVEIPGLTSADAESPVKDTVSADEVEEITAKPESHESSTEGLADMISETVTEGEGDSVVVDGQVVYVRYRSSFTSRLIQAESVLQDYYTAIKNRILSYSGIKSRTSWNYEIFTKGRVQCVKLNVKGKSLTLNLALDPKDYNVNKYHFTDLSDNPKFAKLPMLMKVKSDRSLKYALELIDDVMRALGLSAGEVPAVDYHMPYETNANLAKRGLVKVILPTGVKAEGALEIKEANVSEVIEGKVNLADEPAAPAKEPVGEVKLAVPEAETEEAVSEEPEAISTEDTAKSVAHAPVILENDSVIVGGHVVFIRYRSSFTSRLIQSDSDIQDYYTTLKNYLLSFKGIKSRTSWNYENFAKGRTQCARINLKGKTLTINLALVPESYNVNKYHFTDVSDDPKFDKLPMLLKIRSARALKYAIELIDELMKSLDIPQGEIPTVDYHKPFESNSSLAKRGLMKIILPTGVKLDDATVLREDDKVDALIDAHKQAAEGAEAKVNEVPSSPAEESSVVKTETSEEQVEKAPKEEPASEVAVEAPIVEEPVFMDAQHADAIISDEVAVHAVEVIKKARTGKFAEVNISEICRNFENGDVVTLEELKKKHIVGQNVGRVKILAKGVMTKSLTVEADKFSLQAVKMITLAGGTAKQYM